jgi:hypothetical protein
MTAVEILGLAASVSLLAGWRLYACVLATGIAMRLGIVDLPQHLAALDVLANPWVIGVAALGCIAELLADKVMWIDTLWDTIHTLVRPIGGALLALAIADPSDPTLQVVTLLLGGGAALLSHGAKAGTRVLANVSPEPFSNIALSTIEDVVTVGGLWLVLAHPGVAMATAGALIALAVLLIVMGWRIWRRLRPAPHSSEEIRPTDQW